MKFLLLPFVYVYVFYLFFLMYALIMNKGWTKLSLLLKVILVPPGVVFLIADVLFNLTAGTLIFMQWPTKTTLTLSKRMAANISGPPGWRSTLSALIVDNLLLPFTQEY